MTPRKYRWIFGCALLVSAHAHAWVALAYDEYAGATYLSPHMATAEQAQAQALEACRHRVDKARCVVLDTAAHGNALVVVRGINALNGRASVSSAVNADPDEARRAALNECDGNGSYHCIVVDAAWAAVSRWSALARGEDVFSFAHAANTAEEARAEAMRGCEARTTQAGSCTVVGPSVSDAHAWVVFVESGESKYYAHDADKAVAEAEGLEACQGTAIQPQLCHVVAYHENAGRWAAPETFARIREEARQGGELMLRARRVFNEWFAQHPSAEGRNARLEKPLWYAEIAQ
jgi:hypothetical protein